MPRTDRFGDAVRKILAGDQAGGLLDAINRHYDDAKDGWRIAENIRYNYGESIPLIEKYAASHGYSIGDPVGGGVESLVVGLVPSSPGQERRVLKIQADGAGDADASLFDYPVGVEGIAPYLNPEQITDDVAVAMQPMADIVYRHGETSPRPFVLAADRLRESLWERGWGWSDSHKRNIGVMPDGKWAAIDGWIGPVASYQPRPDFDYAESIRRLLPTPRERELLYGQ